MNVETANSIRITRMINADPQQVFDAWTKEDALQQWSCPEGATVGDVTVDLSVGGRYRIEMKTEEGPTYTAIGVYEVIESPHRLVYTWKWEEMPDMPDSLVTVTFSEVGDSTEVEIAHDRFVDEKTASDHEQGWTSCMDKLERLLA
jgi:uncharacterized protein YndB with AHSA1/START domain